jgi:PAS domain S-box-containing protein
MTSARILVVEDDRVVARDIQAKLKRIGYDVVGHTARGDEAVALARSAEPDLVLMDIRLEGNFDGIEAAEKIRDLYFIPVVFLTAYADEETVRRAGQTEPFGYLLKPFEDSQLRTVVEMALYTHGAKRKLRDSERRYAATLSSIGDAVIATDEHANVTFMNPAAERLTGWHLSEAAGGPVINVFRIINHDTRLPVDDPVAKVLRSGFTVGLANNTMLLAKDGREVPIDDSGAPIVGDHGKITGVVLVFRDITDRYQADEKLRKAQQDLNRMARVTAMGELTLSIAHEIRQPLMAVVTNAATCLNWLTAGRENVDEARRAAERVIVSGHRAGEVVNSIRSLAKNSAPEMTAVNLNEAILEVLPLILSELRRNGVVHRLDLSPDVEMVKGDRVQLQQIVLNLIMNAVEAMSATTLSTRILSVTSGRFDAGFMVISVSDSGPGLESTISERIFETFFTTKSGGMGMGLSICKSIVQAHGGDIWTTPNKLGGTCFYFTVPRFA